MPGRRKIGSQEEWGRGRAEIGFMDIYRGWGQHGNSGKFLAFLRFSFRFGSTRLASVCGLSPPPPYPLVATASVLWEVGRLFSDYENDCMLLTFCYCLQVFHTNCKYFPRNVCAVVNGVKPFGDRFIQTQKRRAQCNQPSRRISRQSL